MAPRKKPLNPSSLDGSNLTGIIIPAIPGVDPVDLTSISLESTSALSTVSSTTVITEITTQSQYQDMDAVLHAAKTGIKNVEARINPIIEPIRKGLDALYELRRSLLKPWEDAEFTAKNLMSSFQVREQRVRDQRAQEERVRLASLQKKADEQAAQEAARNPVAPPMPKITVALMPTVVAPPTRGNTSSARSVKKVRVTDKESLIMAVTIGEAPDTVLEVNQSALNSWLKADPEKVGNCPGLEVYDDAIIAGR